MVCRHYIRLKALLIATTALIFDPTSTVAFSVQSTPRYDLDLSLQLNAVSRRQCLISSTVITTALIQSHPACANNDLNYQGVYTDPIHPKGYRVLYGDAKKATLEMQDSPSDRVHEIPVAVKVSMDGATTFSYNNEVGTLTKDKEGIPMIKFTNTIWKKRETGPIGVYYDNVSPSKRILVRQIKGAIWSVDIIDGKASRCSCSAKAGNPILFSFPSGEIRGVFSMKEKTITFDNGNVWTKF